MDINDLFITGIKSCDDFEDVIALVKNNSSGKIFLIGSMVYGLILKELNQLSPFNADWDFIIEDAREKPIVPEGWVIEINSFGNLKLIKPDKIAIDYIPLSNILSITERELEPNIDNFFSGTPFNIQAIAYDVYENKIIGDIGIEAINKKTIKVNNLLFAEHLAKKKEKTVNGMLQEIADKWGLKI